MRPLTFDGLRELLAGFSHRELSPGPGQRRAAVALTLLKLATEPRVLVIKRASRGRNAGQWALPGGRLDPGEDAVRGALREAFEEVGLKDARVAGRLDDLVAGSGFVITPVVVVAPEPASLTRNPAEVHSLHPISLARLLDDHVRRWGVDADGVRLQQLVLRHDMVVHAPTGAILWQFRELLLGRHTRVADLVQPVWTHR
ncbi:MAG: NUDIX hydrolase [Solirubrobacteraceae bacterium]